MRSAIACAVPFAFQLICITPPPADAGILTYDARLALVACDNGYRSPAAGGSTVGARVFNGVCQIIAEPLPEIVDPVAMLPSAVLDVLDGFTPRNAAQDALTDDILPQSPIIIDGLREVAQPRGQTQPWSLVSLTPVLAGVSVLSLLLLFMQRRRMGALWRRGR